MILSNTLLKSLLALAALAADAAAQNASLPPSRRDQLTQLSQRLIAGDASAIDDLLACTKPASSDSAPSSAQIERLRLEIERLRAVQPEPVPVPATDEVRPATAHDADSALREARAWLRAGDPNHSMKVLPPGDGEALYRKACALERLGRDAEALEIYRRVAAAAGTSPLMKLSAASGVDHVEWRLRRARSPEAKP